MQKTIMLGLLVVGLAVAGVRHASAQSLATFLLVPGIPGSSLDEHHAGWIDVLSLSQSLTPVDPKKPAVACDITVVKGLDVAGPPLWLAAATGQVFPEVKIEVAMTGGSAAVFYTVLLANAQLAAIQTKVDSQSLPVESLTWGSTAVTLKFTPQLPNGTFGSPVISTVPCH